MYRRVFPSWLAVLTVRLWAITLGLMVGWFGFTELAATALPEPSPAKPIQLTTTDDAGVGSLRWAITQANASPDDDVIAFDEIQGEILLHSPLPAIATNLTLMGNGNDAISGGGRHRVLQVDGGSVVIRDLTLADGLARGDDGFHGGGGGAGMGGGLLIHRGTVRISQTRFINNQAVGGSGSQLPLHIQTQDNQLEVNRGAIAGIAGIGFSATAPPAPMPEADISRTQATIRANRGAIAGVSGIGINGIGTIAFGGGGGFGGFGNAGNGGNGGNGGTDSGNGGNGGNGGDGGVGIFGSFARWEDQGSIGTIAFGGGGGFGGFGNAGNGGNGGNATVAIASGGNGGDGGNGGFGGGGGAGGFGGTGGTVGRPGQGGFGGGTGDVGYGGSGGGLGGAIFIRSGSLLLNQVSFERNAAIAGPGPAPGQGKGGAIFISPGPATPESPETQQLTPKKPPKVWLLGKPPTFLNNTATDAAKLPTDNNNIFGPVFQRS